MSCPGWPTSLHHVGLAGPSWPSVALLGSLADAVTQASVLPARPPALCRRCAVQSNIAVLQHHLVLWNGEARHPNAPPKNYGSTVGTGHGCPMSMGRALPGNPNRLLVMGMNGQHSVCLLAWGSQNYPPRAPPPQAITPMASSCIPGGFLVSVFHSQHECEPFPQLVPVPLLHAQGNARPFQPSFLDAGRAFHSTVLPSTPPLALCPQLVPSAHHPSWVPATLPTLPSPWALGEQAGFLAQRG